MFIEELPTKARGATSLVKDTCYETLLRLEDLPDSQGNREAVKDANDPKEFSVICGGYRNEGMKTTGKSRRRVGENVNRCAHIA